MLNLFASPATAILCVAAVCCACLAINHASLCPKSPNNTDDECAKASKYAWPATAIFFGMAMCCLCMTPGFPLSGLGHMASYGTGYGYGGGMGMY